MNGESLEAVVAHISAQFAEKMVRLARAHLEAELRGLSLGEALPLTPIAMPRAPAKMHSRVHAPEHVERMVELVRSHPWPPRSSELQVLLGVKKDPFLRIATLAVATGRVRREGYKAGIRYYVVDARRAARDRPR